MTSAEFGPILWRRASGFPQSLALQSRTFGRFAWAEAMSRRNSIVGWNLQPCSNRGMRANHGQWFAGCTIIRIGHVGCRAMAGLFCTLLCRIPAARNGCTWLCLQEVFTAPRMVGAPGWRATMEYA